MIFHAFVAHIVLALWAAVIAVWLTYAPFDPLPVALELWWIEVRENAWRSNEPPMFRDYSLAQEIADQRLAIYAAERDGRFKTYDAAIVMPQQRVTKIGRAR